MGKLSNKLQFVEFADSQQTEVCWTLNAQFVGGNDITFQKGKIKFNLADLQFQIQPAFFGGKFLCK